MPRKNGETWGTRRLSFVKMFHVEHYVHLLMYVCRYVYSVGQMEEGKRVANTPAHAELGRGTLTEFG